MLKVECDWSEFGEPSDDTKLRSTSSGSFESSEAAYTGVVAKAEAEEDVAETERSFDPDLKGEESVGNICNICLAITPDLAGLIWGKIKRGKRKKEENEKTKREKAKDNEETKVKRLTCKTGVYILVRKRYLFPLSF
jgi:hypothetical protein